MLADLHKGNAAISLLSYPAGGVDINKLDFTDADQIFTAQDSFTLASSDPTTESFRVDQYDEIIDFDFESGDWTINGNIPSWATAVFDYLFKEAEAQVSVTGQDGDTYVGKGYNEEKEIEASVLVESKSKKTAIVLAHVKLAVNPPAIDDHSTPGYVKFIGYVLPNDKEGAGKFAVLKAGKTTEGGA